MLRCSVADPDPGSGAFLTPGSGIGFFRIPDLGSQTHAFESLMTIFLGRKFYVILCELAQIFFLKQLKINIIYNFVIFVATKKVGQQIFFHPDLLLLFLDPGSGIRDPGWTKIRIRDPG